MDINDEIAKAEKEVDEDWKKDKFEDLKGKAFPDSVDTQQGRKEREDYRKGVRVGIGGKRHLEYR